MLRREYSGIQELSGVMYLAPHPKRSAKNEGFCETVALCLFVVWTSCKKHDATGGTVIEPEEAPVDFSEFDGHWVFVGLAHPFSQGDMGRAGILSIDVNAIRFEFVRSPEHGLRGIDFPFIRFEENAATMTYEGVISHLAGEELEDVGLQFSRQITGTGSYFDGMPIWQSAGMEKALLVGAFDPPIMFRLMGAPPVPEVEPEKNKEVEYDDSFS